jgi:hypothetical protein
MMITLLVVLYKRAWEGPWNYQRVCLPVIKDLTSHNVPPNTPAILVSLANQLVVSQNLGIKVMDLERRMVDMKSWALEKEERVMVNELVATNEVHECGYVYSVIVVDYLFKVTNPAAIKSLSS